MPRAAESDRPPQGSRPSEPPAPSKIDGRVEAELVRRMLEIHRVTRYVPVAILLLVVWYFWNLAPHWLSTAILGAYLLSVASFDLIRAAYARALDRDANYRFWGDVYAAASAWAGLCWGVMGGLYIRYDELWPRLAAMLAVITMVTLAVIGRSYYRRAFYAFSIGAAVPLLASLITLNEPVAIAMSVALALFFLSQAAWANATNAMYRKTVSLGYENSALIDQLRGAVVAAEAGSRAKSQFLANMSHEIRTPMNGVVGTLELLDTPALAPDQAELLRVARDSADSLLSLINDVLDLSRIEAAKLKLANAPFSPAEALCGAVDTFVATATMKGLSLVAEIDASVPPLAHGDALRLRQIVTNLIANAVKFTDRGGVTLHAKAKPKADKALLRVSVADSGIGIPRDVLPKLFLPFEQADTTTTRRFGGTGLGLAICRELVELMGGTISAESEEGRGSTFRFAVLLDLVPDAPGAAGADAWPKGAGQRVLVVDDSPVNTRIAALQLERLGYAADIAQNGREALALAAATRYAAVLLDIQMPGLDGYAVARAIRENERSEASERLPIVALTANVLAGEAERCRDAGMDDYLSKPLSIDKLSRVLSRWIAGSRRPKGAIAAPPEAAAPPADRDADIDPAELRAMLGGAAHLVRPMLELFVETAGERLARIDAALATRDGAAIAALAHALKGESANASAHRLNGLAVALEAAAKTGDWAAADGVGADLRSALARIREKIAAF